MPNSMNLISDSSSSIASPRGAKDKNELDPNALAGLTDQFSSLLQQVSQPKAEPLKTESAVEPTGNLSVESEASALKMGTESGTELTDSLQSEDLNVLQANFQTDLSQMLSATMQTLITLTPMPSQASPLQSFDRLSEQAVPKDIGAIPMGNPAQLAGTMPLAVQSQVQSNEAVQTQPPMDTVLNASTPDLIPSDFEQSLQPAMQSLSESVSAEIPLPAEMSPQPETAVPLSDLTASSALESLPLSLPNSSPSTQTTDKSSASSISDLKDFSEQWQALQGEVESSTDSGQLNDFELDATDSLSTDLSSAPELASLTAASQGAPTAQGATENPLRNFVSNAAQPIDQVADGAVYSIKNGHKELVIRLNPDNLGEVRINLMSHGNQEMSARLIATTTESHELLKTQIDSLKSNLEAQGIQVERLSVVLAGSPESAQDFKHHHPSSQEQSPNSQQSTQQQAFNQQGQPNQNLFNQMSGQHPHKPGFAQQPASQRFNSSSDGLPLDNPTENSSRKNDNGNLSILA